MAEFWPNGQVRREETADNGRTQRWGNTVNTDTLGLTGSGSPQSTSMYGRVPVQAGVPAGNYADTVTLTITY